MGTKTIFLTIFTYLCTLLVFIVVACKPEEVVDETKNKLYEGPVRAAFTLQENIIKGNKSFNQWLVLADFTPSTTPAQQIVWEITPKGRWHVSGALKHFQMKSVKENPAVVYRLSIGYYNSRGQKINHQSFDLGQDKIHQHFFSLYKATTMLGKTGKAHVTDKSQLPYDYCYVDQYNGIDIGATNPVGLDGLLQTVHLSEAFNLSIDLLHTAQSKYDRGNQLSLFYLPAAALTSTGQWDITVSLLFDVDGQVAQGDVKLLDASVFQPKTVEIEMYKGHLHGKKTFHQDGYSKNNEYLGRSYRLKHALENNRWMADKTNPAWVNTLGSAKGYAIYAFALRYFDDKYEDMTRQTVDKSEGRHRQHFFTVSNIKPSYDGVKEATGGSNSDFFNYTYCDTDPWNKTNHDNHVVFNDDSHPIGLKGYFVFRRVHKQFTLNVRLIHARQSKLMGEKPSISYQPTMQQQAEETWMPSIGIPVRAYVDVDERNLDMIDDGSIQHFETVKLNGLSSHNQGIVTAMMKTFDLKDLKVALIGFYWLMNDTPTYDSKGF